MLQQLKSVLKDSVIYGFGSLLPKVAGFLLVYVYTRYMPPEEYGILSMAGIVASAMGAIFMLGQNGSVTRFFRSSHSEDPEELRKMLFTVMTFTLAFGAVLLAVILIAGPYLFPLVVRDPAFTFFPYVAIAVTGAYLAGPTLIWQAVARAQRKSMRFVKVQLSNFLLSISVALTLVVVFRMGATGALLGAVAASAVLSPISLWFLRHDMTPRFSTSWLKTSLAFGLPLVPHYFAGWLLSFADRYVLERFTSLAQVGLYSAAYNIAMATSYVAMAVNQAWTPIYYDVVESDDSSTLPRLTTVYAAAIGLFAACYLLVSRDILLVLADPKYHSAAAIAPIVVAGYFMQAVYFITSTPLFYAKRTNILPLITTGAAAVNIGINVVFIPVFGIYAAAWATVAAFAVMAVATWVLSSRERPGSFETGRLARVILLVAIAYAGDLAIAAAVPELSWRSILLRVAAAGVVAAGVFVLDIVSWAEARTLVERLKQRRMRVRPDAQDAAEIQSAEADGAAPEDQGVS